MNPKRARTGAACARLSTSLEVARPPARASSCDATPSSGLVWTSDRSARRTRSWCAGCTPLIMSPRPKPATISGAYVSMSGHMTRMSRGSSVSSSASRPSSTSRRTSIWRAGPWQLCTCTERSSARQRPTVAPYLVGGDVGLQPAQQGVGAVGSAGPGRYSSVCGVGGQAALQFAKVAAEGGQQRMPDLAVAGVVAAGDLAMDVGEGLPQAVAGVRQPQVQVVMGRERVEQFDLRAGQPGVAEQRQSARAGQWGTPAA